MTRSLERTQAAATPAARLTLTLLGPLTIALDGAPLRFAYEKARALLIYLAVEGGRAHRRGALAELLWPGHDEASARHNLSQALFTLRRALREPAGDPLIIAGRETVQLNPRGAIWVDALAFTQLAERGGAAEAVRLYGGEFLEGGIGESAEYEEWAHVTRERLRAQACELLRRLTDAPSGPLDSAAVCGYARRWVALDPLDEAAHRRLMRALAESGQRAAALQQFEHCRRLLDAELGIEPEPATVALYQELRQAPPAAPRQPAPVSVLAEARSAPAARQNHLPAPTTPFVGRAAELAQLRAMLTAGGARLVTITGQGGVGKTRLALQAAMDLAQRHAGAFADGVYLAELAGAGSPEALLPAIAGAIALPLTSAGEPRHQLLSFLRGRSLLLVLDNLEQLVEGAELLSEILRACPAVTILATSRVRLRLYEEERFELQGFPLPDDADGESSAAVQLFVQRARRAHHAFELAPERAEVTRICRLLGGVPLAIELAAGWARAYPCREIAEQIQRSLDFLTTSLRNVPERHRSVRAAFEHSWRLLDATERAAFARLSVFRGGFDERAALAVAQVSRATLHSLADASMVQLDASGRHRIHELLRQLGAGELVADVALATQREHSRYFAAFLAERERPSSAATPGAEAEIAGDLENVCASWTWAVAHCGGPAGDEVAAQLFAQGARPLAAFFEHQGRYGEGARLFREALAALSGQGSAPPDRADLRLAWARLRLGEAQLLTMLSRFREVEQIVAELLPLVAGDRHRRERAQALVTLGKAYRRMGCFDAAAGELRQSLALFRAIGDDAGVAEALTILASVASGRGRDSEALELLGESLAIYAARGDQRGVARILNNTGSIHVRGGAYAEGQRCHERALAIVRTTGEIGLAAAVLSNIGSSTRGLGQLAQSQAHYEEALGIFRARGDRRWVAATLNGLGMTLIDAGDVAGARRAAREALTVAQAIASLPDTLDGLVVLGESLARDGAQDSGLAAVSFAAAHTVTPTIARRRAERLIARLRDELHADRWGAAVARGRASTLDECLALLAEA